MEMNAQESSHAHPPSRTAGKFPHVAHDSTVNTNISEYPSHRRAQGERYMKEAPRYPPQSDATLTQARRPSDASDVVPLPRTNEKTS